VNTKLIEGYVKAVKTFLPSQQQDDIARELSEDILMRLEAREAELNRPLTEAEQEAILKRLGHPALVAGRYSSDTRSVSFGRQLIGPVLFPLYLKVLSITVSLTLAGSGLARLIVGEYASASLVDWLTPGLVNFAIVTAIFSVAQHQLTRHPDRWDPRDPLGSLPEVKDPHTASRMAVLIELVIASVVVLWLWSLRTSDFALNELAFTPAVRQAYWWVLGLSVLNLLPPAVNFFQPRWMTFRLAARALNNLGMLAILGYLLQAGEWVQIAGASAELVDNINRFVSYGLWITLAIAVVDLVYCLYRLTRRLGRRPAAHIAGTALS
jgi:hypothetical protein